MCDKPWDDLDKKTYDDFIEYGMFAPSAVNKQPWHFVIFRDKSNINSINEVHPNSVMLNKASAGILICFDKKLEHDEGYGPERFLYDEVQTAPRGLQLRVEGSGVAKAACHAL